MTILVKLQLVFNVEKKAKKSEVLGEADENGNDGKAE